MINISHGLQRAIKRACDSTGSVLSFAQSVGVMNTTVRDWISGKTRRINDDVFARVLPVIEPFLQANEAEMYRKILTASTPKDRSIIGAQFFGGHNVGNINAGNTGTLNINQGENVFDETTIRSDERRKILDLIMGSDLASEVKIEVYHIIKQED